MSPSAMSPPQRTSPPARRVPLGFLLTIAAVAFVIGAFVLNRGEPPAQRQSVVTQITMIAPPPPPPPPPKEEKLPEPEKIIEPQQEAAVQEDVQDISEEPSPEPATSEPAGLNRPADIGADSFRLAAGKGGGLFGRGGGGGSWDAFVATHVRRALRADPRTSSASGYLEVLLSVDPSGRFERAELQSSTGDKELDAAIRDVLSRMPPLSRGRPANVKPLMVTGINIRATQD